MTTPPENDNTPMTDNLVGALCVAGFANPSLPKDEFINNINVGSPDSWDRYSATPVDPRIPRGSECGIAQKRGDDAATFACGLCQRRVAKTPHFKGPAESK